MLKPEGLALPRPDCGCKQSLFSLIYLFKHPRERSHVLLQHHSPADAPLATLLTDSEVYLA